MTRITRYGREMRTTFIATMFIACLVIVIGIPFVSKQMFDNEVGYYSISIQGNYIGAANTEDEVNVALADARLQLCKEFADYIYMDCDVKITKQRRAIAKRMTTKQDSQYKVGQWQKLSARFSTEYNFNKIVKAGVDFTPRFQVASLELLDPSP